MPRPHAALAGIVVIAFASMSAAPNVAAEGIASLDAMADAESERLATLGRIWHSVTRDALPELEPDQVGVTTPTLWGDEFFRLRASRGCVDWGVPRPPLRLTGFIDPRHRKPVAAPVDVRITPGEPLRLAAPQDPCVIDARARAEFSAAIWQPTFDCTPLEATRVRLSADLTYDWKSDRLTTPLGVTVAQVFRVGPYEAEVSGALRAQPEAKAYDWTYRAVIKLPFPE